MGCWIVLVLVSDAELKLGREKVRARVVLPVRHLGTGHNPFVHVSRPVNGDCLERRFYCCEVNTRAAFNICIESILDIIYCLDVIVGD